MTATVAPVGLFAGLWALLLHVTPWHLGKLHGYENLLALLLAFGPFVILALVIVMRRRDDDEDADGDVGETSYRDRG
jgi:hypothetical protein